MRRIIALALGVAVSGALFVASRGATGFTAASAMLLAMFLAAVVAGATLATGYSAWSRRELRGGVRRARRAATPPCASCRTDRVLYGDIWLCPVCDTVGSGFRADDGW